MLAIRCSNSSLLSQTNAPVVAFQTVNERAPNAKTESNLPSLLKSPYLLVTFNLPLMLLFFNAATADGPPNLAVSNT